MAADAAELAAAFEELGTPDLLCDDNLPSCPEWAAAGECERNHGFMTAECRLSCDKCGKMDALTVRGKAPEAC